MFNRTLVMLAVLLVPATLARAAGDLPDPMRPDTLSSIRHGSSQVPGWNLSSILISTGRRQAVINGRAVAPGDDVDGARVLEISLSTVKLSVHGKPLMLRLFPETVKHVVHK